MSVSREVKRQRREEWRVGTRRAVAVLERRGVCWSDWAAERGFALHAVKDVVRDRNPATRGELFGVASRIRNEAALPLQEEAAHLREVAERTRPEPPLPDPPQIRAIAARAIEAFSLCAHVLDCIAAGHAVNIDSVGRARLASERARAAQALLERLSPPEAA